MEMSQDRPFLVLPRPGSGTTSPQSQPPPIPAPTETAMTTVFGPLLPPASYLTTRHGRAAYYVYPPTTPTPNPTRILLAHGVQTPALGLQPLASALRAQFPTAQIALFDHWGHGLSDTPLEPHVPALFHELIDALLAQLGWTSAHFVGYSFGGATVAGYAASASSSPQRLKAVESMVLVAPAGLLRSEALGAEYLSLASGPRQGDGVEEDEQLTRERKAHDWIMRFLEGGGPLVVPSDWRERVARGEVVAEAIRDWEMQEHRGHAASVVAIFRDGGVLDNHAAFARAAAETRVDCLVVLGELDDLCHVEDLEEAGMRNVVVVPQVGHGLVRQNVADVARHIGEFWRARGMFS